MKKQFIFGFEFGDAIVDVLALTKKAAKEELIRVFGADMKFEYLGRRLAK